MLRDLHQVVEGGFEERAEFYDFGLDEFVSHLEDLGFHGVEKFFDVLVSLLAEFKGHGAGFHHFAQHGVVAEEVAPRFEMRRADDVGLDFDKRFESADHFHARRGRASR